MTRSRKSLGQDAKCSVLLSYLRPSARIDQQFPNKIAGQRLDDLIVLRLGQVTRSGNTFWAVYFRSETFGDDVELYAARRYVKIIQEGPPNLFFDLPTSPQVPAAASGNVEDGGQAIEADTFLRTGDAAEDIRNVLAQGLAVDDDNAPAPENIPAANTTLDRDATTGLFEGQSFAWNGVCQRKLMTNQKLPPGFNNWNPNCKSLLEFFYKFFPMAWLENTCVVNTSKSLEEAGYAPTCVGEILRFIGLWLLMATVVGFSRRDFFSSRDFCETDAPCPYRLGKFMSQKRFERLIQHFRLTDPNPPTFRDRFWEVRCLLAAWRANMAAFFLPAWIVCLDESMSIWHSRWTCPGWVFCPRKPHPFGNEYHTICCGLSGILFDFEIVEGKDHPTELPPPEFSGFGATAGLLLRLTKSIHNTARYVVLDSGFCVLQALVALRTFGVFAGALIKKRRYWPRFIAGDSIDAHMSTKNVGETAAVEGSLDGVHYNVWCMKEPDYTMKIMGTASGLFSTDDNVHRRTWNEGGEAHTANFTYAEPFYLHFKYRHAVDDHNNLRHATPSIEETWVTTRWALRVFQFVLAVTEVNIFLAMRFFVWGGDEKITLLDLRRKLAWELILNSELVVVDDKVRRSKRCRNLVVDHAMDQAPKHAKRWMGVKWELGAKKAYQQYTCSADRCTSKIRTYCTCNPNLWLCACHWREHFAKVLLDDE